ncbi:MAG: UDP-N-acetylglucosamine--N-acetylmuramyl-(pentapeptide) pyrophosphoryl-undecaprenol N-acetylglucosamine transferase [Candidatus Omnitrophota bacterium]|jgi:UDP-N-acetylglucosamine--N-acetylmuramyl-(pentapeptide) pyrophosphoryl-undecaprenol N-acetylglucosamine transferase
MRIIAVTGASGGHIYPALAFLDNLSGEKSVSGALLILPSRSIKVDIDSCKYPIKYISSGRVSLILNRGNIFAFLSFLKGGWESLLILLKFKPDIVVGFGSIDSVFLVMLAWLFRIKTIIHEQNVLPGKANKFLAKFVDKITVSFPDSKRYFDLPDNKIALVGNPIRSSLKKVGKEEALNFFSLDKEKFTILVMGGSQGSMHINSAFLDAARLLEERANLQIIHLLGKEGRGKMKEAYEKINIQAKVFDFFSAMEFAYSAADLAVSRAGATTISELIYFKLPAIIFPYPFAYEHQLENAKILSGRGCAVIMKEGNLDDGLLLKSLELLIKDKNMLNNMVLSFDSFPVIFAANRLKEETLSLY